jgi:hypothetical protein
MSIAKAHHGTDWMMKENSVDRIIMRSPDPRVEQRETFSSTSLQMYRSAGGRKIHILGLVMTRLDEESGTLVNHLFN